ncbi:hypothetical protein M5D96_012013 [Drosophila gunungcola]|uniref:Uncharacterized protein n=1 Tax=Drosophila gunungcola TaxID=103775 RepID=A0A9P9YDV8_9MUSC|nr:hypothetical protein M5D96_012013 [Drosophila gunungcola]
MFFGVFGDFSNKIISEESFCCNFAKIRPIVKRVAVLNSWQPIPSILDRLKTKNLVLTKKQNFEKRLLKKLFLSEFLTFL